VDLRVGLSEFGVVDEGQPWASCSHTRARSRVVDEAGEDEQTDEQRHEEHAQTFQTRATTRPTRIEPAAIETFGTRFVARGIGPFMGTVINSSSHGRL